MFETVLKMNITAAIVFAAVVIIRLLLKKAPKKWSYMLWAAVGFRLVCPVSFQSFFSIFNAIRPISSRQIIVTDTASAPLPSVPVTPPAVNDLPSVTVPPVSSPGAETGIGLMQVLTVIWLVGIGLMLFWGIFASLRLSSRLSGAVRYRDNIFFSDRVDSPFVFGLIRPRIYIPFGLERREVETVLAHEQAHIMRLDHVVKLVSYLILCVHWFNPLVWVAFGLMTKDMEMSCDERVLRSGIADGVAYSETLLALAVKKSFPTPCPIGFGESGVKTRIKNALVWRRPGRIIAVIVPVIALAVLCACSLDARTEKEADVSGEYGIWSVEYASPGIWVEYPEGELPSLRIKKTSSGEMALQVKNDPNFPSDEWITLTYMEKEKLSSRAFDSVDSAMFDANQLIEENSLALFGAWGFKEDYEGFSYYLLQQDGNEYIVLGYRATNTEKSNYGKDFISYIFCVDGKDDLHWNYLPYTSYTGNYFLSFYPDFTEEFTQIRVKTDNGELVLPDSPGQEYSKKITVGSDGYFTWCPESENAEYSPADSARLEFTVKNGSKTVYEGEIIITLLPNSDDEALFDWTYSISMDKDGIGLSRRDGFIFLTDKTIVTEEPIVTDIPVTEMTVPPETEPPETTTETPESEVPKITAYFGGLLSDIFEDADSFRVSHEVEGLYITSYYESRDRKELEQILNAFYKCEWTLDDSVVQRDIDRRYVNYSLSTDSSNALVCFNTSGYMSIVYIDKSYVRIASADVSALDKVFSGFFPPPKRDITADDVNPAEGFIHADFLYDYVTVENLEAFANKLGLKTALAGTKLFHAMEIYDPETGELVDSELWYENGIGGRCEIKVSARPGEPPKHNEIAFPYELGYNANDPDFVSPNSITYEDCVVVIYESGDIYLVRIYRNGVFIDVTTRELTFPVVKGIIKSICASK